MRSFRSLLSVVVASASVASAQTYTDCNPMNKTCTPNTGLDQWTLTTDFTEGQNAFDKSWTAASGTTMSFGDNGAVFNISKDGDAPTVSSKFYIFFGKVEVKMQAAPGTGIISSVVLESDDLDEIDWEWLGGNNTSVENNYFGKGNTTSYDRAFYYAVDSPTTEMHTYTIDWTEESIKWSIDDTVVRTLEYADANGGDNFPQTPLQVKLGSWCGGCSSENYWTRVWAGGNTTFDDAPYLMYIESVKITNYNPASSYNWSDKTGSYDSIDASNSTSVDTNLESTSSSATATGSKSKTASVATSVATVTSSDGSVATVTSTTTPSSSDSFAQSTGTTSSSDANSNRLATYAAGVVSFAAMCLLL